MSTTVNPVANRTPQPAEGRQAAWLTVMTREILVKVTDKSYIIGTLVTLALVLGSVAASAYFGSRPEHHQLAVVSAPAEQLAGQLDALAKADDEKNSVEVKKVPDAAAAEQLVRDGEADAFLQPKGKGWELTFKNSPDDDVMTLVQQGVSGQVMTATAAKAGTSMPEITAATTVGTAQLEGDSERASAGKVMGFIFAVLFMMSAMTYGMQIAQSVIEEKQSRIVEILVAAIPVRHLLAGKVLGNTVMALVQMALLVGTGLVGISFIPEASGFLPALTMAVGWYLLLFLASFLALACVWAAAGAMGTRNEDLQHTSQPLIYLLMGCYMAGFLATGTWKVVLSYVPVVSGTLMPARIIEGSAQWWDGLIALVLNLIFAGITVVVGERIYRRALLQTQGRIGYREAFKLKG
ncbi:MULTISPECIES: ABC transporter permease [unclassified Luteococcus]|uniref:ABC transporter permease n=1 Tax=unclassified Luteococcus TaxID=2639923 RepID=UPI00313B2624